MRGLVLTVALVVTTAPALAQETPAAKPNCAAMDQDLPADLSGWTTRTPLAAAANPADLSKAAITPGKAIAADLPPTATVEFAAQPERTGGSASHGGLFELKIDKAATYAVALGSGVWIDVLKDGKPLTSTAHSHGPDCSTIRKIVDFPLQPGRYVLQLSGGAEPRTAILVATRP